MLSLSHKDKDKTALLKRFQSKKEIEIEDRAKHEKKTNKKQRRQASRLPQNELLIGEMIAVCCLFVLTIVGGLFFSRTNSFPCSQPILIGIIFLFLNNYL